MDRNKQCCEICKKKFTGMLNVQHLCKRCLRCVCKDCGSKKKAIFTKEKIKTQEHRCCDYCYPQSQKICSFVKQNQLSFASQSKRGKQWSNLIDLDLANDKKVNSVLKLESTLPNFMSVWIKLNPSLREFVGLTISKNQQQTLDENIKKTYKQLTVQLKQNQSSILLIIYLLCFCQPLEAGKLASYLLTMAKNVVQDKIISYIQLLLQTKNQPSQKQIKNNLINYTKTKYPSLSLCFLLDCIPVDLVHDLISNTITSGTPQMLHLLIACIMVYFKQQISSETMNQQDFTNYMYKNNNSKNIEKQVRILTKLVLMKIRKTGNFQNTQEKFISSISGLPIISDSKDSKQIPPLPDPDTLAKQANVLNKLKQAQQLIQKIEQDKLQLEQITPNDLDSMDKYLDYIISQNQNDLKACQTFQDMLNSIQQQLYNQTNIIQKTQT